MDSDIDIDETLLEEAMALTGAKTAKGVIEEGLRRVIRAAWDSKSLEELRALGLEGDLEEWQQGWPSTKIH